MGKSKKKAKRGLKKISSKDKIDWPQGLFTHNPQLNEFSAEFDRSIIGHQHNLPDGWKIVAATDPKLDPKYQDIEEFRELQNFYRNKPLSKIMAALGPDEKTKSLWEYAFIAGFYYAKNNNVTRNDAYIWFGEWARGFAHRLIVCADIAFKQGADHYLDRTNPINYVKEPKLKESDNKRYLKQHDKPFILRDTDANGRYVYYAGSKGWTYTVSGALQMGLLGKAVDKSESLKGRNIRVLSYLDEKRRVNNV